MLSSCQPGRPSVTLALLGDLMLARGVRPARDSLAYLTPELQAADLAIANLESPLANDPPSADTSLGYDLCAWAPTANWLPAWGLDLLSLANNHRFDCGPDGVDGVYETASILSNLGLVPIGPDPKPFYREINGLKLALLAFDDILVPLDVSAAAGVIRSAREGGTVVIVSVHWGMEYQGGASERQKDLAQEFAQAGAALVIGTHPHVLQPAAWIPGTPGRTLVLYSLGNALFDQAGLPDTRQSALVLVTLDAQGVRSAHALPFVIDVHTGRVAAPDQQTAQQIHARLNLP
jgi:poly-gamma-glutamate synthesis protein (capsule biosynthesis protein)